ncbi:MAG: SRPBCC family protein [Flavobacteriaceae bacterium]
MKRLYFKITIQSTAERVFKALTIPELFEAWTAVFDPHSHLKGDWSTGSLVRFLTYDNQGRLCGLLSRVRENIPNRKIHIDHVGILENGVEFFEGPEVDKLKGASDIYHILPQGTQTLLEVETDAIMDLEDYFVRTWPPALQKLKGLCEEQYS